MSTVLTKLRDDRFQRTIIFGLFLLGLILKLIGVNHGYPYITNVDEPTIVRSSMGVGSSFWINHFDWPHLNFYLHYAVYFVYVKLRTLEQMGGIRVPIENVFPVLGNDPFIFYLISRILNTFLSALTVIPIYLLSRSAFNKSTALLASFLYIIIPFNLFISHFAVQESSMLFLLMMFVYFAYVAVNDRWHEHYIIAGLFLGLAAGVKYNAVLFAVLLFVFILVKNFEKLRIGLIKDYFFRVLLTGIFSAVGFLITTPSIFKYWNIFWSDQPGKGILWQLNSNLEPLSDNAYGAKIVSNASQLVENLGYVALACFVIGFFAVAASFLMKKYKLLDIDAKREIILTAGLYIFVIAMFLYTSKFGRSTSHYFVPLYGLFAICGASGILNSAVNINKYLRSKYGWLIILPIIVLGFWNLYPSIKTFISPNNYSEAAKVLDALPRTVKTYYSGAALTEFTIINNTGYKRMKNNTIMKPGEYLIIDHPADDLGLKLVREFNNQNSLTDPVYIYEKL